MAKLPSTVTDWTAPWEKEGAKPFDAAEAKQWAFNISQDREREEDAHAATKLLLNTAISERDAVTVERDALKADTTVSDLQRENAQLKADKERAEQASRKTMLDAVKSEFGLTDKQAAKLEGADLEALRNDARETFPNAKPKEGEEGETDEQKAAREAAAGASSLSGPQGTGVRNAGDPNGQTATGPSAKEALEMIRD